MGKKLWVNRLLMLLPVCGWIVNGDGAMADDNSKLAGFRLITLVSGIWYIFDGVKQLSAHEAKKAGPRPCARHV